MVHKHEYRVTVTWKGNRGAGTSGYRSYSRDHVVSAEGKTDIQGSSDPAFRGDRTRWNPEDLLVASLSACHKLWYLHFCAVTGVIVLEYEDAAEGVMEINEEGIGRFIDVVLRPRVTIKAGTFPEIALELHEDAHERCFIANSINFPVRCEPVIIEAEASVSKDITLGENDRDITLGEAAKDITLGDTADIACGDTAASAMPLNLSDDPQGERGNRDY